MMKRSIELLSMAVLVVALTPCISYAVQDEEWDYRFIPPTARAIDKYGVNVISGQVDGTVQTLSIGSDRGLSHSVTMGANNYSKIGFYNYYDKYNGKARLQNIAGSDSEDRDLTKIYYALVLSGPLGSEKFSIVYNGTIIKARSAGDYLSNYRYQSAGDSRNLLEESNDRSHLIWTKPDGTLLFYSRVGTASGSNGDLDKIIYPNGLTYDIRNDGVTTNTGYELMYLYEHDNRGLSAEKLAIKATLPAGADVDGDQSESVAGRNPKQIVGFNRAYEVCNKAGNFYATCNFNYTWPTATFSWPGGMPGAMFLGKSVLSVTNAAGATTEFHYEAKDLCLDNHGDCVPGYTEGLRWVSRITGIKRAASSQVDREYKVINEFGLLAGGMVWVLQPDGGILTAASGPADGVGQYVMSQQAQGVDIQNSGHGINVILSGQYPGSYTQIYVKESGTYNYENSYRNFLTSFVPRVGSKKSYEYDTRGNLEYIRTPLASTPIEQHAEYPTDCSDVTELKRCNKPTATIDARGKRTEFEYHKQSGQISKVTQPADRLGVHPQTRYYYEEKYAWYKNDAGVLQRAATPLWLLVKESTCRKSAASGDGCSGNDEVITEYDYGSEGVPNNLHLRGVKVTDVESGSSRLTCYSYDRFGNKIEEIQPKAEKTSCSE